MTYTQDPNGSLVIEATLGDRERLKRLRKLLKGYKGRYLEEARLLCLMAKHTRWNNPKSGPKLDWISGVKSQIPVIGFRRLNGTISHSWCWVGTRNKSFVEDLIESGEAIFHPTTWKPETIN